LAGLSCGVCPRGPVVAGAAFGTCSAEGLRADTSISRPGRARGQARAGRREV